MGAYLMLGTGTGTSATPTIQGGVTESTHANWIQINSWSISAARPVVSDQGSEESRHRGESQVGEISISKVIDKSTVYVLQDLLQGVSIPNAQIDMTTTEGENAIKVYFSLLMTNVRITNHSLSGAGDEGSLASESFSLNPTSVTWTYIWKDPTDKQDKPSSVGYNLGTVVVNPPTG
jgi:type VI secretion system secreted protein Hcp